MGFGLSLFAPRRPGLRCSQGEDSVYLSLGGRSDLFVFGRRSTARRALLFAGRNPEGRTAAVGVFVRTLRRFFAGAPKTTGDRLVSFVFSPLCLSTHLFAINVITVVSARRQ